MSALLPATAPPALDALLRLAAQRLHGTAALLMRCGHDHPLAATAGADAQAAARLVPTLTALMPADGAPLVVPDLRADPRFAPDDSLALRFAAGAPVHVAGEQVATLWVFDREPHGASTVDRTAWLDTVQLCAALFEAQWHERLAEQREERVREASRAGSDWLWESDADGRLVWVSDDLEDRLGVPARDDVGQLGVDVNHPRDDETRASWDRYLAARARREPFVDAIADRVSAHGTITIAFSGRPRFAADGRFLGYRGASRIVTDELAARQAAQRAERLLKQTIDGIGAGVMISAADGRMLLANSSWQQRVGALLPPGCTRWPDAVRHLVAAGHYPDAAGREQAFVDWRLGLAAHDPVPQELRLQERWMLVSDRLLPDGSVVHLAVDIHDHKLAQAELAAQQQRVAQSEARLAAVLAAVPDLWFVIDPQGRYRDCSDPHHPSLLRPFDELRGRSFADVLPPDVAQRSLAALRAAAADGAVQHLAYELTLADGQRRHFEARVSPMPDGDLLYLTRDLTDLHELADEARRSEERWKFALEGAGDGVWDWDAQTEQAYFSKRWKELLGYAEHEIGSNYREWSHRIHPDDHRRVMEAVLRLHRGETETYETEHRLRHRDGHYLWIRDRGRIVARRPDGRPLRVVGTHSDITRQKQAEQVLRDKQAAELASRAKTEFLSRMSHEMRTPLNAVIGFAQLLRLQGTVRLDHVDHILQAGEHLLALVNDVLDLQQVEAGRMPLQPRALAIDELVAGCIALLQPQADARGVRTRHLPAPGLRVQADEQRLRQVLLNIGSNAIKYNRPAGHVTWQAQRAGADQVLLRIEDSGSGMTADQQARLFQPFDRLGRENSSIEGSGLGLLIARRLAAEMGGRLELTSQAGRGTCVQLTLPAAVEAAAAPAMPAPRALRVLYVEDNRVNALLFAEALRGQPQIELKVAEDGPEALETVQGWCPDVLVLDAHLPGPSGFDVLAQLRRTPGLADAPAFMCSADALPQDLARARAAGFRGYWTKPLDLLQVRRELEALAASPR